MTTLEKVLYTAKAHTIGGREGASRSDDGRLDVKLSSPGTPGTGTNPEQMFAAGYSACFIGAMKAVAGKTQLTLPQDLAVDAEVDLGPIPNAYGIAVRMKVSLPGKTVPLVLRFRDAGNLTVHVHIRPLGATAAHHGH